MGVIMVRMKLFKGKINSSSRHKNAGVLAVYFVVFAAVIAACIVFFLPSSLGGVCADDTAKPLGEPTYTITNLTKVRQNGNNVYLIDSTSNALIFGTPDQVRAGTASVVTCRQEKDGESTETKPFTALKDVAILQDGAIFLIDGEAGGIHEYKATGEFFAEHRNFDGGVYINYLLSIACDYNDNVFVLQKENGYNILKKGSNDLYFEKVFSVPDSQFSELGITGNEGAKIICSFEDETIFLVTNNKVFKIALSETSPSAVSYATYEGVCLDVAMDYLGYPYLVLDSGKIAKLGESSELLTLSTNSCSFDCESGVITYVKDAQNFATFTSEFVNNLKRFEHEVNYSQAQNVMAGVEICKVNAGTGANVYKYPFKIVKIGQIALDTKVIKLKEIENYSGYTYVLVCVGDKMFAGYIDTNKLTACTPSTDTLGDFYTFTANTKLFKYPTADAIGDNSSIVLKRISKGTTLVVQNGVCDYTDAQGREFYEVKFENKIYYVMRALVTDDKTVATSSLQLKANNAHLNSDTPAQVFSGVDGTIVIGEVAAGAKFYVDADKFDATSDYTYIEYLDEDNNFICGFIPTRIVSLDLVPPLSILAVFLIVIVAILVLILILYVISRVRKSKTKEQSSADGEVAA